VPEDGLAADFNHWLGPQIALLTDSRSHASSKNYGLQISSLTAHQSRAMQFKELTKIRRIINFKIDS
jgi:hypothetical protein